MKPTRKKDVIDGKMSYNDALYIMKTVNDIISDGSEKPFKYVMANKDTFYFHFSFCTNEKNIYAIHFDETHSHSYFFDEVKTTLDNLKSWCDYPKHNEWELTFEFRLKGMLCGYMNMDVVDIIEDGYQIRSCHD